MDRFAKIAKRVIAVDDLFTVKKPIKFKPEGGVTRFSLENARMILEAGYLFERGIMQYDNVSGDWWVTAFFNRDGEVASHKFGGFSFGYSGEGPRGLIEFSEMFGIGLNAGKITSPDYRSSLPPRGAMNLVQMF
jgi:hypothetical protein